MVDTCYILKAMVEVVQRVSSSFRGHNLKIVYQVKNASKNMEQDIRIIAVNQQANHLEEARQSMEQLLDALEYKIANGILFSDKALQEMTFLFEGLSGHLVNTKDWLITGNKLLQEQVKKDSHTYAIHCQDFATMHEERLIAGVCMAQSSGIYLNMLDGMRGLFYNTGLLVG